MGKKAAAKDWKAITFNWAELQSYDHAEQLGICLTQRQVAVLKALLTTAYWTTRWTYLTATPDELAEFVAQIDNKLDGNDCEVENMLFRDNPEDGCEAQYSTDGGVIWSTQFRKDICDKSVNETTIQNYYDNRTLTNNTFITYAGDITNVAPDWNYTDPDQDNAICWAVRTYVDIICDQSIDQINKNNQNIRDANDWIGGLSPIIAAAIFTAISTLSGGVLTFPPLVIGAFTYALSLIIDDIFDALIGKSVEAFQDMDARDIIKCEMYDALQGGTPSWTAWRDALAHWETYGGNVRDIAEVVHIENGVERVFVEWFVLVEDINSIADQLPECPCPDTWEHTWDIENTGIEAWILNSAGAGHGPYGVYVPGVGVECTHNIIDNNWHWTSVFRLVLDEIVPRIKSVKVYFDAERGHWDSSAAFLTLNLVGNEAGTWLQGDLSDGDDQSREFIAVSSETADQVTIFFRVADYEPGPHLEEGSGVITKVTLGGTGVDPFSGRDTD